MSTCVIDLGDCLMRAEVREARMLADERTEELRHLVDALRQSPSSDACR